MPKPRLRWPYDLLERDLLDAMLRPNAHSCPQSESEMQGAVLAVLARFVVQPRDRPLTLDEMMWTPESYAPPEPTPPDPPKPQPSDSRFAAELLAAMVHGLHDWHPDLDFPESRCDMAACALEILARFHILRRPTSFRLADMTWPGDTASDSAVPSIPSVPSAGNPEPIP